MSAVWSHVVGTEDAGLRLDQILARRVPGASRSRAKKLIDDDKVRVDGRRRKRGEPVAAGACIELLELPDAADFDALPDEALALVVRLELPELVVIEKPAGAPSHPLAADERGTVANALVARYPEMAGVGWRRREPGIVHRLDTETSGLVLAARTATAFEALRDAQREGRIEKRYRALAGGLVTAPSTIAIPLANDPCDGRRVVAAVASGPPARGARFRDAVTEICAVERVGDRFTSLEASITRGFRHQIRAHLAATGHPLAGDALYGGSVVEGLERQFLHASRLTFARPRTDESLTVESELPEPLARVLSALAR